MEVRKVLQTHPAAATSFTAVITLVALAAIIIQLRGNPVPGVPTKAFYTADDGATYFADDNKLIPPFDRDGKHVVGAEVIQGAGGQRFVAYLTRFSKNQKAKLDAYVSQAGFNATAFLTMRVDGLEVKAPLTGDVGWVPSDSAAGRAVVELHPPPGVSEPLAPAEP